MTKIEILNRKMLDLEHNGDITEGEYATYKALLEAVEALKEIEALLKDHPEASNGNAKVHWVCCKARTVRESLK